MSETKENKNSADRELLLSRLLDAPVELVWTVLTEAGHISQWWGPDGFRTTIHEMDLRPGGSWQLVMHGPDGTDYPNEKVYREVVKHERIVFEHVNWPKHTTTLTLEPQGDKTLLTWHMVFESKEQFEEVVRTHKADTGLQQNIAKLEKHLAAEKQHAMHTPNKGTTDTPLVIERSLPAPVAAVWQAITDREMMQQWYFDFAEFKAEVGFEFTFTAEKKGVKYVHLFKVLEVIPDEKLSYSWQYEGYEGYSVVTFELSPEVEGTHLRLTHRGLSTFPADNPNLARSGFEGGWTQLIGTSLVEFLAKQ